MPVFQVPTGEAIQIPFSVFEEDGITPLVGLVDGDFTKKLLLNDVAKSNVVTVDEVPGAPGSYVCEFTTDAPGSWYVEVTLPLQEYVFGAYVQAGVVTNWTYPIPTGKAVCCGV